MQNGRAEKKRQREEEAAEGERKAKRDKADDDDEEMEIDDEEEGGNACTSHGTFKMHLFHTIFFASWGASASLPSDSASIMYESAAGGVRRCFVCSVPTVSAHPVSKHVSFIPLHRYHGFKSTSVTPTEVPHGASHCACATLDTKTSLAVKKAQVLFDSPQLAAVAKEALHGFTLKKDWVMSVVYLA